MSVRLPRTILLCAAIATALIVPAAPAFAAENSAGDYCWENLDTAEVHCFGTEAELSADLAPQTFARSAATTLYTLATWYENTGYGGAYFVTRSSNSALCVSGSTTLNFSSSWNNRVSSYKTWYGCAGTIYDGTSGTGSSFGPSTAASSVGSMNDKASSFRLS
ncbi:MAG TPA: hypothetical protein VL294_10970 [Pseudolysinimonas sp.]|jgi:hypothetical protein|nr:hypothetical protein [Pseudolysinimonas sp.]